MSYADFAARALLGVMLTALLLLGAIVYALLVLNGLVTL